MKTFSLITALMLAIGIAACNSTPTGGNNTNNTLPDNKMTATVNGKSWSSTTCTVTHPTAQTYVIAAASVDSTLISQGIGLSMFNVTGTGTYTIGGISITQYVTGEYTYTDATGTSSYAGTSTTGTLTITEFSATNIRGNFSFTAPRASGTNGPATGAITSGQFNVKL